MFAIFVELTAACPEVSCWDEQLAHVALRTKCAACASPLAENRPPENAWEELRPRSIAWAPPPINPPLPETVFVVPPAIADSEPEAVLKHPANNPACAPLATCDAPLLQDCRSIAPAPCALPNVALLS